MEQTPKLLEEAMGKYRKQVIVIEDCVDTSGSFLLHHLVKRFLSPQSSSFLIFVAFAQPFSHYDRILRKMGCNLVMQKDNKQLLFFEMLKSEYSGELERKNGTVELRVLYRKIYDAVEIASLSQTSKDIVIMIDDISLMEVAANGSTDDVLDFLHYCHTLTTQFGCSFVVLTHEDIYSASERVTFILQMEYLADVLVKAGPLPTGLAADVHGQLTLLNKGTHDCLGSSIKKMHNFHFRLKETHTEYFYPGSQA